MVPERRFTVVKITHFLSYYNVFIAIMSKRGCLIYFASWPFSHAPNAFELPLFDSRNAFQTLEKRGIAGEVLK